MNSNTPHFEKAVAPTTGDWPVDGLEYVEHCPVCGAAERTIIHSSLIDNAFFVAQGKWTLWKCTVCGSGYLDPRPSRETLPLAYTSYYTHSDAVPKAAYETLSFARRLRRRLINGYTGFRFGTQDEPATVLGVALVYVLPPVRCFLEREYRHLPRRSNSGQRLLDVGCGDGAFLKLAKNCGWDVIGVDPDARAIKQSVSRGLQVYQGGIEKFAQDSELFDVITLNHVIEHVHEPVQVLKSCYRLLKPGGQLWIETPNIDSLGHKSFGANWRGLEAPRHLVIFSQNSLVHAMKDAGFEILEKRARPDPSYEMYRASFAMTQGASPYAEVTLPLAIRLQAAAAAALARVLPQCQEFLTLTARKGAA